MSLHTQLAEAADKKFDSEYRKLFTDFCLNFRRLTGVNLEDQPHYNDDRVRLAPLAPLFEAMLLRYSNGSDRATKARENAKELHRERFIAEFLAKHSKDVGEVPF